MSLFTQQITWPTWKFGVLKTGMVGFGLCVGMYYPEVLLAWSWPILGITLVTLILSSAWGIQSMFAKE